MIISSKSFFKAAACITLIGSSMLGAGVSADAQGDNTYAIRSYQHNIVTDSYELVSQGSAVAMDEKQLLTNAHVILTPEHKPYVYYEVCKSNKGIINCFDVAELVKYDKDLDLAVLETVGTLEEGSGVTFGDEELTMGDSVTVYGYPRNGGNSLTLTRGVISGEEKGLLKIDANLDSGNSGGGAFNEAGEYIGMPSSAVVGFTTLGYIIPVPIIKGFLVNSEYNLYETTAEFIIRNQTINKLMSSGNIVSPHFSLDTNKLTSIQVQSIAFDTKTQSYNVSLSDTQETVKANIYTYRGYGSEDLYSSMKNQEKEILEEVFTKHVQGTLERGSSKIEYAMGYGTAFDSDILQIQLYVNIGSDLVVLSFYGPGSKKNELLVGLSSILTHINIKSAPSLKTIEFSDSTFTVPEGVVVLQGVGFNGAVSTQGGYLFDQDANFRIENATYTKQDLQASDIESFEDVKSFYKETWESLEFEILNAEIKENKKGNKYIQIVVKSGEIVRTMSIFYIKQGDSIIEYILINNTEITANNQQSYTSFYTEHSFGNDYF